SSGPISAGRSARSWSRRLRCWPGWNARRRASRRAIGARSPWANNDEVRAVELHELAWAGGERPLPVTVELADCAGPQVHLRVHRWLHATPARHDVLARWDDRYVLARLLTGPDAGLDLEREKAGAQQLAAQELPTLTLLREGCTPELDVWLLYEADDDVQRLDAVWENLASQAPLTEAQQSLVGEALGALGALHGKGLWPTDPALRRFIRHRERIHLLDAGTLRSETPGSPLGR